jgi:hypothetical protein
VDTKRRTRQFPIERVDKRGWNLLDGQTLPLHPSLLTSASFSWALCLLFNLRPLPMVMASNLPPSRFQAENDLRKLWKVIGWQSLGYDSNMRPGDFIFFLLNALSGLVPLLPSFFFMLLKHYGLQLQHL